MIRYQGISTLEVLEDAKNYNKWIASQLVNHMNPPILEIGAGTGNLTKHFLNSKPLYITDCDEGLTLHLKKAFSKEKDITIKKFDISKKPDKKYLSFFSTIYAINVLEHIKDDTQAIKNMHKILNKNGKLLLLVPAKKRAYTKLDRELGHYRRYEKNELISLLARNGFCLETVYFFNIVGLLSWVVRDKVARKNIQLTPNHIKIFDSIVPFLRVIESVITLPVGISLVVVAKKI